MKLCLSCVIAFGFWLSLSSAHARQGQVKADSGGVAVGGSVSHSTINIDAYRERASPLVAIGGSVSYSTINIGLSQEKVEELVRDRTRPLEELTTQQRENITLLKEKLDLNEGQVRRALDIIGEANVPPGLLAGRLVEVAERYKVLLTGSATQPGDSPNVIALKGEAQKAIDTGDLDKADALLAQVETEQRLALDRFAVNAADTAARRGQIALTRLRYAEAATHFAQAAAVFPPGSAHEDKRLDYLEREANALYQQGDEAGDNSALVIAIERWRRLIEFKPRERVPLEWAWTQMNLAVALMVLGERESGTAKLDEAVAAYREVLKEYTRERVPLDWARSLGNQGVALVLIAERRRDAAAAKKGVNQINTAYETLRDGGDSASAEFFEEQLPTAHALASRLSKK